ncbi:MAG: hypothetical protein U0223_07545 [Nitrospira sp.]|nr:hypothetical protein [Nitrospira sp.]
MSNIAKQKVRHPVSGKMITIASAVKLGFMKTYVRDGVKYLEWADHAFPPESDRERWKRDEQNRIQRFIKDNPDLPHPGELGAVIESDNGRLRLWFEILEHSSSDKNERQLDKLTKWKQRLVRFDKKRDPLPHPIPSILSDLEKLGKESDRKKHTLISKEINRWIAERLYDWEKGDGKTRSFIDMELFGMLRLFNYEDGLISDILNKAQARVRRGDYPFADGRSKTGLLINRDEIPVNHKVLKSLARTWKKRQQPL